MRKVLLASFSSTDEGNGSKRDRDRDRETEREMGKTG
jgi:hypothetical protein